MSESLGAPEGWAQPDSAKKPHYFVKGASLCGRWVYSGPVQDDHAPCEIFDCNTCHRELLKLLIRRKDTTMHPKDHVAIGVDIGPMPGIVGLRYSIEGHGPLTQPAIIHCTSTIFLPCLRAIIPTNCALVVIFYERYVVSGRAARVKHAAASEVTRNLAGQIETLASDRVKVIAQNNSDVLNWAIDERLEKGGLLLMTKGMPHARSAGRHAIYGAKNTLMVPDPLSRRRKPALVPAKLETPA